MDTTRARRMERDLSGSAVGGWMLENRIGNGASALVFRAHKDGRVAALKVFDPELIERSSEAVELTRVVREVELRDHPHENLVRALDGGKCSSTSYLYLAMEFIPWPTLSTSLAEFPRDRIQPLMGQLSSAAEHLERLGVAHRDIKPDNIAISPDFLMLKLLDLGVCRPLGGSSMTDQEGLRFVGTTRYSSPEYLRRQEEDSPDGWRALTFYQLGGVLHDVIMREPLFHEHDQARLVEAVLHTPAIVAADDVPAHLVQLARNCLTKDPRLRLSLVSWGDFQRKGGRTGVGALARERLLARLGSHAPIATTVSRDIPFRLAEIAHEVERFVRGACVVDRVLPAIEIRSIHESESLIRIRVNFEPTAFLRGRALLLSLEVRLLDLEADAISVGAFAAVASDLSSVNAGPHATIFRGVLDLPQLDQILRELPYLAFDEAEHRISDSEDQIEIPLSRLEDD
jgi:serine/threonine protein kinase